MSMVKDNFNDIVHFSRELLLPWPPFNAAITAHYKSSISIGNCKLVYTNSHIYGQNSPSAFAHKVMKYGIKNDYATLMNLRYGVIVKSHPGCHSNHFDATITVIR